LFFFHSSDFLQSLCQTTAFTEHIALGALTSEFFAERRRLEGRIERLRIQHTEAIRDKSAAENRSRNLLEKLTAAEAEKEDLGRQLAAEREGAKKARAEASLALKRATDAESGRRSLRGYVDKMEASTRVEVNRPHALLMDAYRQLGARTALFNKSGEGVGLRFLGWLQE
jgi:chromosome segregation ATPase